MKADTASTTDPLNFARPTLEDMQHWTGVMGRAQQLMLEHLAAQSKKDFTLPDLAALMPAPAKTFSFGFDTEALIEAQTDFWKDSLSLWQRFLAPDASVISLTTAPSSTPSPWQAHPLFDMISQAYGIVSQHMLRAVEAMDGLTDRQREQLRFATRAFTEAMAPANFTLTNPKALERIIETRGESLLKGLEHLLADLGRGQLTHSPATAFQLGRDIAATPGKVIHETPLYQLIQYSPTTETVLKIPILIFPPWINRFYILDLGPKKSFVRWAVDQGLTVFMVSWKSADASLADILLDDYVAAQIEAIEVARDICKAEAVHVVGYCVAGTTLAATLALMAARGEADRVKSATFFTAQVDFTAAGDLTLFIDDAQLDLIAGLASGKGYVDGRYLAATFNLLRGKDLIWNYVVQNYLLGEENRPFDLLHWNGDTTNLPANWHKAYLRDFYRDNLLARPGGISVAGIPIDLSRVTTPSYVQAGREDHIAPAESVWKITDYFRGPIRFVLAGSGHIAGVVNPPAADKYQYWTSEEPARTLTDFISHAHETKGSWWPDWAHWIAAHDDSKVPAKGARIPGRGKRKAIEDAPGRYVKQP